MMLSSAILIGLVVAGVALFVRSAWMGSGWPNRVVHYVYNHMGSLDAYQKSGRRHASAVGLVAEEGEPALAGLVRRIAPSQVGWLSRRFPTDKGSYHDYLRLYDALFEPYREVTGLRLLEVGVKKGGSLVLWRELFAESAFVYGIEVNPDAPRFPHDAHIKVLILDSRDQARVRGALGDLRFDIIIDDGLHTPEAQWSTFANLRPCLAPTGVYVIEDVYSIEPDRYREHGDDVKAYPDPSGQQLVVVAPPASLVRTTRIWNDG